MATTTSNLGMTLPVGEEDVLLSVINGNSEILDTEVGTSNLKVSIQNLATLPYVFSNSKITAKHEVTDIVLSNNAAQPSDWSYTTAAGSLTISGTISGTTDIVLYLAKIY